MSNSMAQLGLASEPSLPSKEIDSLPMTVIVHPPDTDAAREPGYDAVAYAW
jgi:hypothetical protein